MRLPMRVFWLLSDNVDRIRAETDIRAMKVAMASQSGEGAREALESLSLEVGTVCVSDPVKEALQAEPDEEGISVLKAMAQGLM